MPDLWCVVGDDLIAQTLTESGEEVLALPLGMSAPQIIAEASKRRSLGSGNSDSVLLLSASDIESARRILGFGAMFGDVIVRTDDTSNLPEGAIGVPMSTGIAALLGLRQNALNDHGDGTALNSNDELPDSSAIDSGVAPHIETPPDSAYEHEYGIADDPSPPGTPPAPHVEKTPSAPAAQAVMPERPPVGAGWQLPEESPPEPDTDADIDLVEGGDSPSPIVVPPFSGFEELVDPEIDGATVEDFGEDDVRSQQPLSVPSLPLGENRDLGENEAEQPTAPPSSAERPAPIEPPPDPLLRTPLSTLPPEESQNDPLATYQQPPAPPPNSPLTPPPVPPPTVPPSLPDVGPAPSSAERPAPIEPPPDPLLRTPLSTLPPEESQNDPLATYQQPPAPPPNSPLTPPPVPPPQETEHQNPSPEPSESEPEATQSLMPEMAPPEPVPRSPVVSPPNEAEPSAPPLMPPDAGITMPAAWNAPQTEPPQPAVSPHPPQSPAKRANGTPELDPAFAGSPWADQALRTGTPMGRVIGMIGPKGGVGKTTMSLWLAEALTAALKPPLGQDAVVVVDANLDNPNIAKACGVWRDNPGLGALLGRRPTTDEISEALVSVDGLGAVLPGPQYPLQTNPDEAIPVLDVILEDLRHRFSWIILDLPVAGTRTPLLEDFALKNSRCDLYVVVLSTVNVSLSSVTDWLWGQAKPPEQGGSNLDLTKCVGIVNRADESQTRHQTVQQFVEKNLGISVPGFVPSVAYHGAALNEGRWQCPRAVAPNVAEFVATALNVFPDDPSVLEKEATGKRNRGRRLGGLLGRRRARTV